MNKAYLFITIILGFLLFVSCEDELCTQSNDTRIKIELNKVDNSLSSDFISSISMYSAEWMDSVHYNDEGEDNMLRYPLSASSDTTMIIISSNNSNDTVTFYHQREIKLISQACGFATFYTLHGDTVHFTENVIDSIKVLQNEIKNKDEKHITIYF